MNVQFLKGTYAKYNSLASKDPNTFYYTSDENGLYTRLFLGALELTGGSTNEGTQTGGVSQETFNALVSLIGTLPDGINATNIVDYIIEAIDNSVGDLQIRKNNTSGLEDLEYDNVTECIQALTILDTATATKEVGGIKVGDSLTGKSVYEVLMDVLCPYVPPTFTVSHDVSTTLEKGDNSNNISKVTIRFSNMGSNSITKAQLYQDNQQVGNDLTNITAINTDYTFSGLKINVPASNVSLAVKVYDDSGKTPTTKTTGSFTFVYPYYYGVCGSTVTIDDIDGNVVSSYSLTKDVKGKGTKTYEYTCDNEKMIIAFPSAHKELSSIINQNNYEVLSTFSKKEVQITGLDKTSQTYLVYLKDESTTVSKFKMKFTHKS